MIQPLRYKRSNNYGFTLLEISITLVIVGLIAGGILAAQSMMRSSQVRAAISQYNNYRTAMHAFREQYNNFPGDIPNATSYWGSAGGDGHDADCIAAQPATATATCNGNGNMQISHMLVDNDGIERFLAWRHLANAGLIEGTYTGKTAGLPGGFVPKAKLNTPAAKLPSGYFDTHFITRDPTTHFPGSQLERHVVNLFGPAPTLGILRPQEAWDIDTKLDDGNPVSGNVFSNRKGASTGTNCTTSNANDAVYDTNNDAILCILHIAL